MAASDPIEWRHFDVILLKLTAAILAAAMLHGDRTTALTSLAGTATVYQPVTILAKGTYQANVEYAEHDE